MTDALSRIFLIRRLPLDSTDRVEAEIRGRFPDLGPTWRALQPSGRDYWIMQRQQSDGCTWGPIENFDLQPLRRKLAEMNEGAIIIADMIDSNNFCRLAQGVADIVETHTSSDMASIVE